jgi:hypothetical protein
VALEAPPAVAAFRQLQDAVMNELNVSEDKIVPLAVLAARAAAEDKVTSGGTSSKTVMMGNSATAKPAESRNAPPLAHAVAPAQSVQVGAPAAAAVRGARRRAKSAGKRRFARRGCAGRSASCAPATWASARGSSREEVEEV